MFQGLLAEIVAAKPTSQDHFTRGKDSILQSIAKTFQSIRNSTLCGDALSFVTPSVITDVRPDLVLHFQNRLLYKIELIVGFEPNLASNANLKTTQSTLNVS